MESELSPSPNVSVFDDDSDMLSSHVNLGSEEVVLPVIGPTLTRLPTVQGDDADEIMTTEPFDDEVPLLQAKETTGNKNIGKKSKLLRLIRFLWSLAVRCCQQLLGRNEIILEDETARKDPILDQEELQQYSDHVRNLGETLCRTLRHHHLTLLDCCRMIQHWQAVFTDILDNERLSDQTPTWNVVFEAWNDCLSAQVKTLGEGTGGVVRVHRWLLNGGVRPHSLVAVKQFRTRKTNESVKQHLSMIFREFTIGAALKHSNIIETRLLLINDCIHADAPTFSMVQDYPDAPCHDLFHIVQRCSYSREEALCWFKQLLRGVEWMHRCGVAHRDLKPENICIDRNGLLRIIDFGLATLLSVPASHERHGCHLHGGDRKHGERCAYGSGKHASQEEENGDMNGISVSIPCHGLCGSLPYIPPEEFSEFEYDAAKVDVWMSAIVFLVMIYHAFPWQAATSSDPYYKHYSDCLRAIKASGKDKEDFYLFARLRDPQCASLLQKMLHTDPKRRVTSAMSLDDPWLKSVEVCMDFGIQKPHRHTCCQTIH